jgi:hypothetical protein
LAFSAIVAAYLSRLTAHPPILPNAQSLARSAASSLWFGNHVLVPQACASLRRADANARMTTLPPGLAALHSYTNNNTLFVDILLIWLKSQRVYIS